LRVDALRRTDSQGDGVFLRRPRGLLVHGAGPVLRPVGDLEVR